VFVRLDHSAGFIVNANHGVPIRLAKLARFFQNSAHYENDNSPIKKSNDRLPLRHAFILIPFVLACFAISPTARAVTPAPDGGYPNANTAEDDNALFSLDTSQGIDNTAMGFDTLYSNTTGLYNTATGFEALDSNTTGNYNTASGQGALSANTTGRNNTANGQNAMLNNTTGSFNIALGDNAGFSLTTGDHNIDIGNKGVTGEAKTIRIGSVGTQTATFIAGICGVTVAGGVGVIIDTNGHLGTVVSSERFKDQVKPMNDASEASCRSNQSPSAISTSLTQMASHNSALSLNKWKR